MPKTSSKKPHEDSSQAAHRVLQTLIAKSEADVPPVEPEPDITEAMRAAAAAFGRMGGKKGGPARSAALTPERRAEIARAASLARWKKL